MAASCTLAPLAVAPEVNALCRSDDPQAAHPVLLSQELEQPLAVGRLVVNARSFSFAEYRDALRGGSQVV